MRTYEPRYDTTERQVATRTPLQVAAGAVGAVFVLVGVLGFVPGVTTNIGDLTFAGHDSESELLGLFSVNILHNLVHIAFGAVGLLAMRTWNWAKAYLLLGGVVYLVLWLYGTAIDHDSAANFVNLNTADDLLHLGLGVGLVALGLVLPRLDRA